MKYDTLNFDNKLPVTKLDRFHRAVGDITTNKFFRMSYSGVPLIASGLFIRKEDYKFRNLRNYSIPRFSFHYDDYLQYSPAVAMLALKAAGVQSYSSWPRMLTADVFSAGIMAIAVNSLKYSFKVRRPDGTTRNSFPSGHTATAFMTATMLHKEYGLTHSSLYSVAGYGVATFTGVSRMMNNRHWLSDVLVGAGVGIISTELGYYFADLIFKKKGLQHPLLSDAAFDYTNNPSFVGFNLGFDIMPVQFNLTPQIKMKALPGSNVGIEGAWFWNRHWGAGGKISSSYMSLTLANQVPDFEYDNQTIHLMRFESDAFRISSLYLGPYFSVPLTDQCLLNFKINPGLFYIHSNDFTVYYKTPPSIVIKEWQDFLHSNRSFNIGYNIGHSISYVFNPKLRVRLYVDYTVVPSRFKTNILLNSSYEHHKTLQIFSLGTSVEIMLWK